jgi:integrase
MVVFMKRFKTKYPGVFFREAKRVGGPGKEKVFYIVFKRDGKYYEEKAGRHYIDDMTAAKASRIRAERIENKRLSRKEIRENRKAMKWAISALWDEYMATHPENKSLPIEARSFNRNLRNTIGHKEPSEIVPMDVDRIRLKLQREGKHTTAARVLELLRRTINFGIKRNLVPPLVFKIEVPRLNNQVTEDLTPQQLTRLLKTLDEDEDQLCANLMRLALYTGMRRGEISKLKWDDIDTDRGFIQIRDPKGGPDQKIPLNEATKGVFNAIPKDTESPYVFPGRKKNEHLKDMRKSIARIKEKAGFPDGFRPLHGLRHVYASMLASSGQVDMYTLQKLLTHKSPVMTQRYAHLRDDVLKRASDIAGNIIERASMAENDEMVVNLEDKKK